MKDKSPKRKTGERNKQVCHGQKSTDGPFVKTFKLISSHSANKIFTKTAFHIHILEKIKLSGNTKCW